MMGPLGKCRFLLFMFAALIVCANCYAEEAPADSSFETRAGAWWMPSARWEQGYMSKIEHNHMHYSVSNSAFTTYEGDFLHKPTGINFGVSADVDDNMIGKINRISGFIGYDAFYLRLQKGTMQGVATWDGALVGNETNSMPIDADYVNVDLIKWYRLYSDYDEFWGFGYTSFNLPVQLGIGVKSASAQVNQGVDVYEPAAAMQFYSFVGGFDTLRARDPAHDGFGAWIYMQDRFGLGTLKVSDSTRDNIQAANPGTHRAPDLLFSSLIEMDLVVGFKWEKNTGYFKVGAGLGYNFFWNIIIAGWNSMTPQEKNDVGVVASPSLYRHGPILKLVASW